MQINRVSNSFLGLWTEGPTKQAKPKNVAGMELDNIYLQTMIYHPFKDEEPSSWCEMIPPIGYNYLEYDSKETDSRLYEENSVTIQQTQLGEKLDVTSAQYAELLAIKKAGEEAAKKLNTLGSAKLYQMQIPVSGLNDSVRKETKLDDKTIGEILSNVEFVG